jgi:hypothetical protein
MINNAKTLITRNLPTRSSLNAEYLTLFFLGLGISLLGMVISQSEDMGVFITVSSLIGKGYRLYADVFDIKDPLFFYSLALVQKFFGITGMYLFDAFITALALPLSYRIALKLQINKNLGFLASCLFFLSLTGLYGSSLRSQILGIVLLLYLVIKLIDEKWNAVGFLLSLILFTKMPFFLIAFSMSASVFFLKFTLNRLKSVIISSGLTTIIVLTILQIRGEFIGYIEMVKENFLYSSNYQIIAGQQEGILGHFAIWNGSEKRFTSFLICLLTILYLRKDINRKNSKLFLLALGANLGTAGFLLLTALWPHHLQIISFYILFDLLALLSTVDGSKLNQMPFKSKQTKLQEDKRTGLNIKVAAALLSLIALMSNSGWVFPLKSEMPTHSYVNFSWSKPTEISMLESIEKVIPLGGRFARLGMNDDTGFGAFIDAKWKLTCERFMIGGSESQKTINSFLTCLRSEPDIILTSPFYVSQKNRPGTYGDYFVQSQKILSSLFYCNEGPVTGYTFCIRKALVPNKSEFTP